MLGLVSTIRLGFAPLGIPNTGLGSGENKMQGGLPPGGIRFGFKPLGTSPAPGSGIEYTLSGGGHSELFVTAGTLGGGGLSYAINTMSKRTN